MTPISIDISGKLEPGLTALLESAHSVCKELGLQAVVVGALARDIHFLHLHGIAPGRATLDVDFAVLTESWDQFQRIKDRLINQHGCIQDTRHTQRLRTLGGLTVDLIPFGTIEEPAGHITWPPGFTQMMSTAGFAEALSSSQPCRVRSQPALDIQVITMPAIAALKLLSWADGYPERRKDAQDLLFVLRWYLDAGQSERLWHAEQDLMQEQDFDYDRAGARLLGRDIGRMVSPRTAEEIQRILDAEVQDDGPQRLLMAWLTDQTLQERKLSQLIHSLRSGFIEGQQRSSPR